MTSSIESVPLTKKDTSVSVHVVLKEPKEMKDFQLVGYPTQISRISY